MKWGTGSGREGGMALPAPASFLLGVSGCGAGKGKERGRE